PTEPIAKITPTRPGARCRYRYMKISSTAKAMLLPRLEVAVQPAIFQSVGLWMTTWIPSHISCQKPLRPLAVAGCGCGSGLRIAHRETAETRKDAASI